MLRFSPNVKGFPFTLSGGDKSAIEACELIKQIVNEYKKNVIVRNLSANLVYDLPSNDYYHEVKRIFEWVRDNIRYLRDIRGCETLQTPLVTLPFLFSDQGIGQGDCDDHVILLASMLHSIGTRDLKMRIVKYTSEVKEWQHIYLVWTYKGQEISLDAIAKRAPFGWEVKYFEKKDINL